MFPHIEKEKLDPVKLDNTQVSKKQRNKNRGAKT